MAVPAVTYAKAYLQRRGGPRVDCLFNPQEYSVTKSNVWTAQTAPGQSFARPQFGGGKPRTLSLELFFDESDYEDGDVRPMVDELFKLTEVVDPQGGAGTKNDGQPPVVEFGWGSVKTFDAVVESLTA